MIMAVMAIVIKSAKLEKKFAAQIGLTAFAASCPTSMILLTGDSTLNMVAMNFVGAEASWLKWLLYMGIPGLMTSILLYLLQIWIFPGPKSLAIDTRGISEMLEGLGPITRHEKGVIFWVLVAIGFWTTDFIHHIHPDWITIGAALMMTLPRVGAGLKPSDWSKVNLGTLFFLTGSGNRYGRRSYRYEQVGSIGSSALVCTTEPVCVCSFRDDLRNDDPHGARQRACCDEHCHSSDHSYSAGSGISPIVASLLVYTAVDQHYLLPFHNMAILVGEGEQGGNYNAADVFRLGLPLTALVLAVTGCVEVPWWRLIGLIR
jgi:di/tricarboxylate transporter